MFVLADTQTVVLPYLSLAIGIVGLAGLVFAALKYRRDDTTAVVSTQDTLFNEMKSLNEDLKERTNKLSSERDDLQAQVTDLQKQINELHQKIDASNVIDIKRNG